MHRSKFVLVVVAMWTTSFGLIGCEKSTETTSPSAGEESATETKEHSKTDPSTESPAPSKSGSNESSNAALSGMPHHEKLLEPVCGAGNVEGGRCASCPDWTDGPTGDGEIGLSKLLPAKHSKTGTSLAVVRVRGCRTAQDHATGVAVMQAGQDGEWTRIDAGPFDQTEECRWLPSPDTHAFICRSPDPGWAAMFAGPKQALLVGTISADGLTLKRPLLFSPNFEAFRSAANAPETSCPSLEKAHSEIRKFEITRSEGKTSVAAEVAAVKISPESGPDGSLCDALREGWSLPEPRVLRVELPVQNGSLTVPDSYRSSDDSSGAVQFAGAPAMSLKKPAGSGTE